MRRLCVAGLRIDRVAEHVGSGLLWQATIQRLRQQRQQVERLKWESRQQKATIDALRAENSRLDAEVSPRANNNECLEWRTLTV